eukprot:scaffold304726_cov35-Tisochrysis_lutea.AAC.1
MTPAIACKGDTRGLGPGIGGWGGERESLCLGGLGRVCAAEKGKGKRGRWLGGSFGGVFFPSFLRSNAPPHCSVAVH